MNLHCEVTSDRWNAGPRAPGREALPGRKTSGPRVGFNRSGVGPMRDYRTAGITEPVLSNS
jgi:hypothetical protein